MTADFGVRPPRRQMPIGRIIAAVWIVALLGAVGAKVYLDRHAAIKVARAWTDTGPPCPTDPTPANDGYQPGRHAFFFEGEKFLSDFRAVKCSTMRDHGGLGEGEIAVCRLKGSTQIDLTTAKGRFRFATSHHNATVSMEQGVAACVLGAS